MSWIYKGKEFTETNIPENGIGFIYHMSVILNGNTYAYIGKKNFFSNVKKKLGKKALALVTDKRLKKYTKEQKANFENYYSSNQQLKDLIFFYLSNENKVEEMSIKLNKEFINFYCPIKQSKIMNKDLFNV